MKTPKFICAVAFSIALIALFVNHAKAQNKKPNFVLFLTDDIGWGDIGCYGNTVVKTPNIDRLAKKGLQFQNAYLVTSSCSPSRSSIISGRYPHNSGASELFDVLSAGQVMFPALLKKAGYYTVLSGKNDMGNQIKSAFDLVSAGEGPGGEEDYVSIINDRSKDKPFFFWFASHDAHRTWQISEKEGVQIYNPKDIIVPPMMFDGPETRKDIAGYYHEISRADYYLGEVVKALEKQGVLDNTYIIFMSDNGSPFPGNKTRLYDRGIKTPFIIYGPKVKAGLNEALISSIDIAPTILSLANIKASNRIQGKDFTPLLSNSKKITRDFVFAEHNWHVYQAHERMVRYGDWVYIRNSYPEKQMLGPESNDKFPAGKELWDAHAKGLTNPNQIDVFLKPRAAEELFNVKTDPLQFNNGASLAENQNILDYLRKTLDSWIKETGDSKPTHPTPNRQGRKGVKGERPGDSTNAQQINNPGPILK